MAASILASAQDALYALVGSCCKTDTTLKLNGRSFKILKLLGEGGFSYVYLAQDQASKRLFALKKIRCPAGDGGESVKVALKEVEAYKRFRHENIIRCLDSCVVQDREGDGKIIYLFLPYYKNATVQHVITSHLVNGTHYPESQILEIFKGTCRAVKAMHQHSASNAPNLSVPSMTTGTNRNNGKGKSVAKGKRKASDYPPELSSEDLDDEHDDREDAVFRTADDDDDDDGAGQEEREGQSLIGGLEATRQRLEEEVDTTLDDQLSATANDRARGGIVPWAHRDIKPANIMISDDGRTPILMDFGSALPARIEVPDRRIALLQQDLAAEHCSMPFRAPELFDVKTGVTLDEKVDIWSLGCTLYAMAYSTSPFETTQESSHGGSIAMAVLNGKYSFPAHEGNYSTGFKTLVEQCLQVKPQDRPDIDQVLELTEAALARLQ
ncbi:uncharacterized protein JCM15063_000469 [Sporobolomyces koalae]|uniref:uncharacterized protein n=1 Tax=Sporobolomyces koalae TaxID=500713 RepID=UPI00316B2E05